MLIHLDDSLRSHLDTLTGGEWDALNNLALAAREGNHFLLAPRPLTELLALRPQLGIRERALYRTLNARYTTIAGMTSQVQIWVRVSHNIIAEQVMIGQSREIRLPLSFFSTTTAVQPAILLCENLDDCYLIYEMARILARTLGLGNVRTVVDRRAGGGATTADVAEDILVAGDRLLVTIVDSDRETPGGSLGETARTTRRVFSERSPAVGELVIIQGRELENLLPDEFYRSEFGHHVDHGESVDVITALEAVGCGVARLHIDVKEGLKLEAILSQESVPDDFVVVWGLVVVAVAERRLPVNESCVACAAAGQCANPQACTCLLTGANRMNLLALGAEAWRENGLGLLRTLPHCLESAFTEVARAAFDWGCAASLQSA